MIGVSGVVAEKTGAAREFYNRASGRARVVAKSGGSQPVAPIADVCCNATALRVLFPDLP